MSVAAGGVAVGMTSRNGLRRGDRHKARILDGATMRQGARSIDGSNIVFVRTSLGNERFGLTGEDVGGNGARRVESRAARWLACWHITNAARALPAPCAGWRPSISIGDVEFF